MFGLDIADTLFVLTAFVFQVVLIGHFTLRRWWFETALRYGPIVYVLGFPAAVVSVRLLLEGRPWWLWIGGFLYLVWAIFGYIVEYRQQIEWRSPVYWPVFAPYLLLYLATVMFYWWPLARLHRPLWYVYALLFLISTGLNLASHKGAARTA